MLVRIRREPEKRGGLPSVIASHGYGPVRPLRKRSVAHGPLRRLKTTVVAFDTEGTGLIPYGDPAYWGYTPARPFAFSFCDAEGNTGYIRWAVDPQTRTVIPGPQEEQDALRDILENPEITKVGHNIAYDIRMCLAAGFTVAGPIHDTQVLAHVVTAGDELSYALKPLAKKYSGFPDEDEKDLERAVAQARLVAKKKGWLIAGGKKEVDKGERVVFAGNKPVKADYWLVPSPSATTTTKDHLVKRYAIGDVERTMLLFQLWWPELLADPRLMMTYLREMRLFTVLRRMETYGTRVYPDRIDYLIDWYKGYMEDMKKSASENGGLIYKPPTKTQEKKGIPGSWVLMNFESPKQLMKKFYEEKGYEVAYLERKNKKTGETKMTPTLGKDQLAMWGGVDEDTGEYKDALAKAILEYRAAHQSIKSFLKIYQRFMYPVRRMTDSELRKAYATVGRSALQKLRTSKPYADWVWQLHPNYNQTGAVTGRMTCSDPNLQQVASATTGLRKADIPSRPRECFGPRPGCVWYLPDYSQIEVWLFAFLSGEKKMQAQLLAGHDFHQAVASISFGKRADYEERKPYYRKLAKLIMFGKLYGGGVGTREKPGRMTRLLQMPFDDAKAFIDSWEAEFTEVKRFMKRMSDEATRTGEAWNLYGRKYKLARDWAYKVVNYLIQGGAADMLKTAMVRLDYMLSQRWNYPGLRMINTVHDEIIIEVPLEYHSRQLMQEVIWVMQMDSSLAGVPVPLPVGMKIAPRRWSHPKEVELPKWVKGGVPRTKEQRAVFRDVARLMAGCPPVTLQELGLADAA